MERAVRADLDRIRVRDADLAESGLAHLALQMAREMDSASNSATSKSMCAHAMQDALKELRELAPAVEKGGALSDIRAARARRLRLAD